MGFGTLVFLGIIVVLVVWVIAIYNKLVTLKNRYVNAFSQIEVQLKRRYDLIPNLIETAKGYLAHERGTLEAVIAARNQAVAGLSAAAKDPGNARAMEQLGSAEGALGGALGRLNVVMEAYPDLKANQNMMQLSEELTSTENRVVVRAPGVQRPGHRVQHLQTDVPAGAARRSVRARRRCIAARIRRSRRDSGSTEGQVLIG